MKLKGFTLAEMLIALVVIGVIAALTLPSLYQNIQKQTYVSQLQNITAILDEGFKLLMNKKNCFDMPCTGLIDPTTDNLVDNITNSNVFEIVKTCHMGDGSCYVNNISYLDGTMTWWNIPDYYSIIVFKNGSIIGFNGLYTSDPNCENSVGTNRYNETCTAGNLENVAFIDVNGSQPPNTFGRDIFRFYIAKDGTILPEGTKDCNPSAYGSGYWGDSGNPYGCETGGDGQTCFARVVEKGWKMDY